MIKNFLGLFKKKNHRICYVFLLYGSGISIFLKNSLLSLRRLNTKVDVYIYYTDHEEVAQELRGKFNCKIRKILVDYKFEKKEEYLTFKSLKWNSLMRKKYVLINNLLNENYDVVVYCDADVVFLNDPSKYILKVSENFEFGAQSESLPEWPTSYCAGFMFFTQKSKKLVKKLINIKSPHSDQFIFNKLISKDSKYFKKIFTLPESLFQNGLHYKGYTEDKIDFLLNKLKPFVFHANYVLGLENKLKLLKKISLWFLDEKIK